MADDSPVMSQDSLWKEQAKSLPMHDLIKHVPLEDLIKEIRRRQLAININGTMTVKSDGTTFSLAKMPWPEGEYEILVQFVKEIKHEEGISNDSEK